MLCCTAEAVHVVVENGFLMGCPWALGHPWAVRCLLVHYAPTWVIVECWHQPFKAFTVGNG